MTEEYQYQFPAEGGLVIGVVACRDGKPIAHQGNIPIFAKYYVADEFGTPVLDPSCDWFASPNEALFVARAYAKLVEDKHFMPSRFFIGAYAKYLKVSAVLPEVLYRIFDLDKEGRIRLADGNEKLYAIFRKEVLDM